MSEQQMVCVTHGYPQGYEPKRIEKQFEILKKHFSHLNHDLIDQCNSRVLPVGAEAWFVIPRWYLIASTYEVAVSLVIQKVSETYHKRFLNYCTRSHDNGFVQTKEKCRALRRIEETQQGGCIVIPAQFGLMRCGVPTHRIDDVLKKNEFGLGAYEVGIMLLTHPERFRNSQDLWIECIGDICTECKPVQGLKNHPLFLMAGGEVRFTEGSGTSNHYGAATGFLVP